MRRVPIRRLVLWGGRPRDIQFGSRDDWRRHIPVGDARAVVAGALYFDVGDSILIRGRHATVTGREGSELGLRQ